MNTDIHELIKGLVEDLEAATEVGVKELRVDMMDTMIREYTKEVLIYASELAGTAITNAGAEL